MTEPYAEALRASYDAVLNELEAAADTAKGLADLRSRHYEQQAEADELRRRSANIYDRIGRKPARVVDATTRDVDVRFLTVAEAATVMRVSSMTVYRLVHSGELEAIRVGRSFRIPERALSYYLRDEAAEQRQHRE